MKELRRLNKNVKRIHKLLKKGRREQNLIMYSWKKIEVPNSNYYGRIKDKRDKLTRFTRKYFSQQRHKLFRYINIVEKENVFYCLGDQDLIIFALTVKEQTGQTVDTDRVYQGFCSSDYRYFTPSVYATIDCKIACTWTQK